MAQPGKVNQTEAARGIAELTGEPSSEPVKYQCDLCGEPFEGSPESSGLFLWTRGDEVRFEEPPLCAECAQKISASACFAFALDDDDGDEE